MSTAKQEPVARPGTSATIRLNVYDRADGPTQLERALALVRDLEKVGLEVTLTGDIFITAKVPKP